MTRVSPQVEPLPAVPRTKVSVLMACYNAEAYIEAAIESILRQTSREFELVIVDDGSTDRSLLLAKQYAAPNVILLRQDHAGASKARNLAFRQSRGEFVIFVDADDMIATTHLEALHESVAKHPGCLTLSRWARFRSDPSEAMFPARPTEVDLAGPDWLQLDWRDAQSMTQSGMLMLPRTMLETHGLWNEQLTIGDDFEFFARMISRSRGVRFAPDAALYYRSSVPNSMSTQRSRVDVESDLRSLTLGTEHLLAVRTTAETKRVCANLLMAFEYRYFPAHADLRKEARRRLENLGAATIQPDGPPGFHRLRPLIGWKAARIVQLAAEQLKLNKASRSRQKAKRDSQGAGEGTPFT